jgi:putative transcriptional regulator
LRGYLRALRTERGYSQQYVADYIGITTQYYAMIEGGRRKKNMDLSLASKLASLFGVSINYMLEREGEHDANSKNE